MPIYPKVVILIPTYNEKDTVAKTLASIDAVISQIKDYQVEVLIFDSASPDGTAQIVQALQTKYNYLKLSGETAKSGLGSAYIKAMRYAMQEMQADIVIEYDADGSHQPKYLPLMLERIKNGADVVVGSRYVPDGSIPNDWAWYRKLTSISGNWVARLLLTNKYKDFTSGFRATKTEFLKKIELTQLLTKNYAYKLHLFWALHKINAKIEEYPIEFIDRKEGYSKFPKNNIYESLKVVTILRLRELKRYFRICTVGGAGVVIQFTIFNILRHELYPTAANLIAIELAIVSNFILNNIFSFSDQKIHISWYFFKKLLKFNCLSVGSILSQTILVHFGIELFGRGTLLENMLVLIGIGLGSVLNYFLYTRFVWVKQH